MSQQDSESSLHKAFHDLLNRAIAEFAKHQNQRKYIPAVENVLQDVAEMKQLVKLLRKAISHTRQLDVMTGEKMDLAFSKVISRLVCECFSVDGPPEVNPHKVEEALRELDWCTAVEIPLGRFWAYLHQCEMGPRLIDLDGPLQLRKATLVEKAYFVSQGLSVGGRTEASVIAETKPSAKTSQISRSPRRIRSIVRSELLVEFDYLVTVLRLLYPSSVGINLVVDDETLVAGGPTISMTHNTRPDIFPAAFSRRSDIKCEIDESRRKLLIRLMRKLRKTVEEGIPETTRLLRSLRRYNRAASDDFVEDEVIDLSIILETIVRAGGHTMASRVAQVTATAAEDRQRVETTLRKIHRGVRSTIVHGASFNPKDVRLVDELFDITCRALRSYIVLIDGKGGITQVIDRVLSNRDERMSLDRKLAHWIGDTLVTDVNTTSTGKGTGHAASVE